MNPSVNDYRDYDAVLLIGDEALKSRKRGLAGFEIIYDLATEWYEWKKLPFVFAVWAVKSSVSQEKKNELQRIIRQSLAHYEEDNSAVGKLHAKRIGITGSEAIEYLAGFNFRIGSRERMAIEEFRNLVVEIEKLEQN
jgi:chorismate dehydratase